MPGRELQSEDLAAITQNAILSRGLGRSYGDASLPPAGQLEVVNTLLADRILGFDETSGLLHAEAGFTLKALNEIFWPRGFAIPVTPGTQYVTLGGMVASDVHGKNHHRDGCIGNFVQAITLRAASNRIVRCTREHEADLFFATLGGMGLTGHILEVELTLERIETAWIWLESERIDNIDAFLRALKEAGPHWPFTVGWIDCLSRGSAMGRGILNKGRWARKDEAPAHAPKPKKRLSVPFLMPSFVMGRLTVLLFNMLYFWKHVPRVKKGVAHPESFYYPLDAILNWNRLYGKRGFTQYQCVIPEHAGVDGVKQFLNVLTARGGASFLCVIKDCGAEGPGMLTFPMPGVSIALDIAVRDDTQALVDALNECLIKLGGRIYLTKDSFTRADHFRAMEPRLDKWLAVKRRWDPDNHIQSHLFRRIF